jgi:hypothetical protein
MDDGKITKEGFKQRICRNMGLDAEIARTEGGIILLFSDEARKDAKTNPNYKQALDELVKERILNKKGEKYNMNIEAEGFDC